MFRTLTRSKNLSSPSLAKVGIDGSISSVTKTPDLTSISSMGSKKGMIDVNKRLHGYIMT